MKVLFKSSKLAELIGIILGDGCVERYPRTERLWVTCNVRDRQYIRHIYNLIKSIFKKEPKYRYRPLYSVKDIYLYQQHISERLGIPLGNKIKNNVSVPKWINSKRCYIISCLKGLFETDGCFQEDRANYAQYIEFENKCKNLLEDVFEMLVLLGYHPQKGKRYIRLARKKEVYKFKNLIKFRIY